MYEYICLFVDGFVLSKDLLEILLKLLKGGVEVEVTARCLLFLLEIHHGPILANQVRVPSLKYHTGT